MEGMYYLRGLLTGGILAFLLLFAFTKECKAYELPGYYRNELVVDPLIGVPIYGQRYVPVVKPVCYNRDSSAIIPCKEGQHAYTKENQKETRKENRKTSQAKTQK